MSVVVTLPEVQHWAACRSVELRKGTTLTPAARDWLADRGINITVAEVMETATPGAPSLQPEGLGSIIGSDCAEKVPSSGLESDANRSEAQRAVITVLGRDRVGIIAAVASSLASHDVNVLDISQTLFGDLFSMTMVVDIGRADVSFAELRAALESVGLEMHLKVVIQLEAVFDYMHRV